MQGHTITQVVRAVLPATLTGIEKRLTRTRLSAKVIQIVLNLCMECRYAVFRECFDIERNE